MATNSRPSKLPLTGVLLDELEQALAHGTVARRVDMLRRVTDLFVLHVVDYSDQQIAVFDDVFTCLVDQIESDAKALLAERLGPLADAPPRIIRTLAFDDAIEVAAPVLSQSEKLDDHTLIENARSKSQQHLLAISVRKTLSGSVTDALIERGNDEVVCSLATNHAAHVTEQGYTQLVSRADGNDAIASCVGLRPSIPRHHFLKLVAKASESVRARLQAAHPAFATDISQVVARATRYTQQRSAVADERVFIAHGLVRSLFEDGRLNELEVVKFAESEKFDEVSAAIACLANVPIDVAENMMVEDRGEGIFILSKLASFTWKTVSAIFKMRNQLSGAQLSETPGDRDSYERLRPATAQQVLRFYRMQQATSSAPAA